MDFRIPNIWLLNKQEVTLVNNSLCEARLVFSRFVQYIVDGYPVVVQDFKQNHNCLQKCDSQDA